MRLLVRVTYIIITVTLGVLAKDNLIAEVKHLFSPETQSSTINTLGKVEVAFSPNKGATASIIRALSQARSSILVSAYSFTSKEIAEALLDAKKRKVAVKIILDKSQVTQRYSSSTFFANNLFDLKIDVKHAIFHNKIIIIDNKTLITGSFNFTKAAETKNAENILIIRDNPELATIYAKNWWSHWKQSLSLDEFAERNNQRAQH